MHNVREHSAGAHDVGEPHYTGTRLCAGHTRLHAPADVVYVPYAIDVAFLELVGGLALVGKTPFAPPDMFYRIWHGIGTRDHTEDGALGHPSESTGCCAIALCSFARVGTMELPAATQHLHLSYSSPGLLPHDLVCRREGLRCPRLSLIGTTVYEGR